MGRLIEIILKVFGFFLDPLFRLITKGNKAYRFVDGNDGSVFLTDNYDEAVGMLTRANRGVIYDNKSNEIIISR